MASPAFGDCDGKGIAQHTPHKYIYAIYVVRAVSTARIQTRD